MKKINGLLIALLCMLSISQQTKSQSIHFSTPIDSVPRIEFRYLHSFYKEINESYIKSSVDKNPFYSATYELAYAFPISKQWQFQTSIPFGISDYEMTINTVTSGGYGQAYGSFGDPAFTEEIKIKESDQVWGNLKIGVSYKKNANNNNYLQLNGSLFIPTASRGKINSIVHMSLNNMTELYRYINNTTTLFTQVKYGSQKTIGWNYAFSGGLHYLFTGTQAPVGDDLYLNYGVSGSYSLTNFAASCELLGAANLTDDDDYDDFLDRSLNSLNIGVHYTKGRFKPSLFYSVYLKEEMRDQVNGVLGIKLAYSIR